MLSKSKIKYILSLKLKKYRQKYNNFVAEGEKIANEIIENQSVVVESIIALDSWIEKHQPLLHQYEDRLISVTPNELKKISFLNTPNQVLIVAHQNKVEASQITFNNDLSLFLDGIQDPGNMGTILRIADWFGIKTVVCAKGCVDVYNPKVVQSSMGAFLRIHTPIADFDEIKPFLGKLPVYGTILAGENVFKTKLASKGIVIIGNESRGISSELQQELTHQIAIPPYGPNGAESLNAAVATGIICAWFRNFSE